MPKFITIPILGENGVPRWESVDHDDKADETTLETFQEFVFDVCPGYLIDAYGVLPGDIIIPEDGYRYVQALQLDVTGRKFVKTAQPEMDDGFAIGWNQIPRDVEDPVAHFASLLEDNYIELELTPEVYYGDGAFHHYIPGRVDSILSKEDAYTMRSQFIESL